MIKLTFFNFKKKEKFSSKNKIPKKYFPYYLIEKYFCDNKKEILELFEPEEERLQALKNKYKHLDNSFFIHIRRGDYVNHWLHYINLDEYYKKSIEYVYTLHPDAYIYIISNDLNYCKSLSYLNTDKFIYSENTNELDDLYLMSLCNLGGICCNSSYSWWGAYLNTNVSKIVIFPNKWVNANWNVNIGFIGCNIMNLNDYTISTKLE